MNLRVVDKADPVLPRSGEAYDLYLKLVELMENEPDKKVVVEFSSVQTGQRRQQQILEWADADGYQLFASPVPRTKERVLYLETKA